MSEAIKYLHSTAAESLGRHAASSPESYTRESPADWQLRCNQPKAWFIESSDNPLPDVEELTSCLSGSSFDATSDAEDSLSVYGTMSMLTPQQAADYRLWVGLAHFALYTYVRKRWDSPWLVQLDGDKERARASRYIQLHWFVRGARGLVRDNGVSRLWWMGRIITLIAREADFEPSQVGEILFERADVRAQLIERPATASNIRLAAEITKTLATERGLIERSVFRRWMISLNQLGGVILIDGLRHDDVRKVVYEQANAALR